MLGIVGYSLLVLGGGVLLLLLLERLFPTKIDPIERDDT